MNLETDEWITGAEAARLIRLSPQRVNQMTDEGALDVLRPWPRVTLVSRRSIAQWLAGQRLPRILPADVRRYVLKESGRPVRELDIDAVRDLALAFITEARPRWERKRLDLWALQMASHLCSPRPS